MRLRLLLLPLTATLLGACATTTSPAPRALVTTLDFTSFEGQRTALAAQGVRVFGKNASLAQDVEPEYITVSADGRRAWVTLQENNALALLDLGTLKVEKIVGLGFKDHAQTVNALDASDRDGGVNIRTWPVRGMYQPDGVAAFEVGGQTYLITANEGDARAYTAQNEETTVSRLTLDPTAFPDAAALKSDAQLGRLTVTSALGDADGDGDIDALHAFGARSFSIHAADGARVYDSGDLIERRVAAAFPANFNANSTSNTPDNRSDNKGPEPEGVTVGQVGGRTLAFVGLERQGGVLVVDVTTPTAPEVLSLFNPRDFTQNPNTPAALDLAPEGLLFIAAQDSPSGRPMLVVANETSGTTTLIDVAQSGTLSVLGRYTVTPYAFDRGAAEIAAYDKATKRLFVVNAASASLDILDVATPATPTLVKSVPLAPYGGSANSVAVHGGVVAVAVQNDEDRQANGKVVFLNADGTERAAPVEVGALPDMLTFTPDGSSVLVANEGEPSDDYTRDPLGTVSVIDVRQALARR